MERRSLRQRIKEKNGIIDQDTYGTLQAELAERPDPLQALPGVTCIIPCFNHGEFVEDAVFSCLNQNYTGPKEVLVINDGSTDPQTIETLQLLPTLHKHIRVLNHARNKGLAAARNTGFEQATHDYLVPLDADDMLHGDFLKTTMKVLLSAKAEEHVGFVYTDVQHIGNQTHVWKLPEFSAQKLFHSPYIVCTSLMRKDMWNDVWYSNSMGYDEYMSKLGGWEDALFYMECAARGWRGKHVGRPLFFYRKHAHGSMVDDANKNLPQIRTYIRRKMNNEYGVAVLPE